ncbi:hypothetical protein QBC38DRAFT_366541 [Podospora fimiseda]|uniref:Serum paraoxonase/arylesterase n=1 Tax=Podospora fimiseda TaxID=252190 RepID=A0AAN7BN60_9PEZI|nr:hypothetical protein QBC38DRAFT_366541 [Podospora fimiseda]
MRSILFSAIAAFIAYSLYLQGPLIQRAIVVLGIFRRYPEGALVKEAVTVIPDTTHCEDLHHHAPSGLLYTACEDDPTVRFKWFPPLANFDAPQLARHSRGSIHVIDPKTFKSERLMFENWEGPFITHGIDVIDDPELPQGKAVYVFAVNHLPNPNYGKRGNEERARSQIEIFHHTIGSTSIRHVRSVWHPLIRTPNDIFAISPTSFYVTNDHFNREHLARILEDVWYGAKWTDTIHIKLDSLSSSEDSATGFTASVALDKMHNNNGLGHGRSEREVLIGQASSGIMHIAEISEGSGGAGNITIKHTFDTFQSVIDNPSYFADPFAKSPADDRSGFVLPGVSQGANLAATCHDPEGIDPVIVGFAKFDGKTWDSRVIFEDDGSRIRSASAAVLLAIDPSQENGARKAWLFVTGFASQNIISTKVDL